MIPFLSIIARFWITTTSWGLPWRRGAPDSPEPQTCCSSAGTRSWPGRRRHTPTPAGGATTAAAAGGCRGGGVSARTSTRATGGETVRLYYVICSTVVHTQYDRTACHGYFHLLNQKCNYFLVLLDCYPLITTISWRPFSFSSQSSYTNWKKALDAWFWNEIDLFPVSSVYRFKGILHCTYIR